MGVFFAVGATSCITLKMVYNVHNGFACATLSSVAGNGGIHGK